MIESAQFFNDMGVKMAMEGLHNEAIACLKKGLTFELDNGLIWLNLGLSYYAAENQMDCKFALSQSIKYNPEEPDAWDSLGLVLFKLGELDQAERAFERALRLEPSNGKIWNNYGAVLFNKERYKDACKAFESAITLEPDLGDALFNLRDTYLELGNNELAEKCSGILKDIHYKE